MKAIKFFLIGLITVGFVACNNEDGVDVNNEGNGTTKAVTLKLDGIDGTSIRDVTDPSPEGNTRAVTINELRVVFYHGTIVDKIQDVETPAGLDSITKNGTVFHNVPNEATDIIVVGNYSNKGIVWTNVTTIQSSQILAANEQKMDDITFYGNSAIGSNKVSTEHTGDEHPNTTLETYIVTVPIKPLVSRFEITAIECTDLGDSIESIKLTGIGLVDFIQKVKLNSASIEKTNYVAKYINNAKGYIAEPGTAKPGTLDQNLFFEFGKFATKNDTTILWSYEKINNVELKKAPNNKYVPKVGGVDQVFAFNFITSGLDTLPNIKLGLTDVKTIFPYIIPEDWKYVTTASSAYTVEGGTPKNIKPGYIYRINYAFEEANVGPYNPTDKKCIRLTITVEPWKIKVLTPTFH